MKMLVLGIGIGFVAGVIVVDWIVVRPAHRLNGEAMDELDRLIAKIKEMKD